MVWRIALVFPPDGAFMPMTQRQMRDPACQKKDRDAAQGYQ
jgi:hypothetical protein